MTSPVMAGDGLIGFFQVELLKKPTQLHAHRAVDDNTESARAIVLTNESDGAVEIRVGHSWHGDEELITERIL